MHSDPASMIITSMQSTHSWEILFIDSCKLAESDIFFNQGLLVHGGYSVSADIALLTRVASLSAWGDSLSPGEVSLISGGNEILLIYLLLKSYYLR